MTKKTSPAYRASKEETIPINKLHPFSNHPFHIRHDLEFSELVDSISESGIITPIIVRPKAGVGYEVISGRNLLYDRGTSDMAQRRNGDV